MTQEFNPDSLFGKHRFITEQFMLGHAISEADRGLVMIDPNIIRMSFPFVDLIPHEKRRLKAREHFDSALLHLHNMGVV